MNDVKNKLDLAILKFIESNKRVSKVLLKYFDFGMIKKETAYVYFDLKAKRYKICLSEKWIEEFTAEETSALIEHEVSHALLRHLERKQFRNMDRWNIATDLFINETNFNIRKELRKKFPNAVWLDTVKLKEVVINVANYTVEQLYDLLEGSGGGQSFDEHLLDNGMEEEGLAKEKKVLGEMIDELERVMIGKGEGISNVLFAISKRERENRTLKRILNNLSKTVYKKSNTPSSTFKRRSRRLYDFPFIKGKHKKNNIPYILVGIDTSGSMQQHEQLILRFISSLKNYNIQYDLSIGDESERLFIPHTSQQKQLKLTGYGGTDLSFIDNRFKQGKYDGVVIFTDGHLPCPPETPTNKTILVLTENTENNFNNFRIVKIKQ